MRRLLVESHLYFARPRCFNDPLDCAVPPKFKTSQLAADAHWRKVARRNFPHIPKAEQPKVAGTLAGKSATREGQEELARVIRAAVDRNGTACFATDPTNVLLWSYYAQGHAGIAVRFGFSSAQVLALGQMLRAQGAQMFLIDVQYQAEFPEVNWYTASTFNRLRAILGTKAIAWKHEGEWRIVLVNRTGYLKIPRRMIDGVVFGMRTDRETEKTIREWVRTTSAIVLLNAGQAPAARTRR